MHLILAFTKMHDRLLYQRPNTKQSETELFHYYNGTAMFNRTLESQKATPSERDALWIASTLVGTLYMGQIEANTPEEAWPLKSLGPGEPEWLTLSLGKTEIWEFCDPSRSDCCFKKMLVLCNDFSHDPDFTPYKAKDDGFPNLDTEMRIFLGLSDSLTWTTSPYFRAANIISQLLPQPCNQANVMKFATFTHLIDPKFRALWGNKDPGALLLVSYWLAKAIPSHFWWIW